MRIGRTVPPAAAPLCWKDLWYAIGGMFSPKRAVDALEQDIREHFDVSHTFLVSSGTAALALTLMALKSLCRKTEVVIPAYTCFSVPAAILKAGLRPTLCDVNPSTFDFDHALLEQMLSADTLCVIAHHLFGVPSEIERIRTVCDARRIYVVEDTAQAMGVEVKGRRLGTFGDVGIFSLGRGKNITCGSGGIIVTNSDQIADAIAHHCRQLGPSSFYDTLKDLAQLVFMTIFIRPSLYWMPAALPFLRLGETIFPKDVRLRRLSGMKAGFLRNWRSRLIQSNRTRAESSTYFSQRLALSPGRRSLHPYVRLPILVTPKDRQRIYQLSQRRGLGVSLAYPTPINDIPEIRAAFSGKQFPSARRLSETLLTLPTHQWMSEKDRRAIAELCRGLRPAECPTAQDEHARPIEWSWAK